MRMYSCPLDAVTVTNDADQDLLELVNGSTVTAILHQLRIESNMTTDERLRLRLVRRTTTGSGGTGATEVKVESGDASPVLAVSHLVTTPGTIGDILEGWQWSQLAPNELLLTPECRIIIPPSGRLCLNLQTAVAASRTMSGSVKWQEIG